MFAKIIGKRTTALATSLAVVVGLVISPALAANATEGAEPVVVETPVTEVVEAPPAPVVEAPPAPVVEAPPAPVVEAPPAEPVEAPEETPLVELVETPAEEVPAPQNLMRSSTAVGTQSMGTQSLNVQSAGIQPDLQSEFLLGQSLDVQFYGVDADRWTMNWDGLSDANLTDSGYLDGHFSRAGNHTMTVNAQEKRTGLFGIVTYRTIEKRQYHFKVVPAVLTPSLPSATVGDSYSEQLDGTLIGGILKSNTFSLANGSALPDGLSLSQSGVISGTPTDVSANPKMHTFEVTLRVRNLVSGTHYSAPKSLSIAVGYPAPTWGTLSLPAATVGVPYTATSVAANGNGWDVGSYTATGLPQGLSLSTDGVISGTPTLNTSYSAIETVSVTFTADNGKTSTTTANIVVKTPPTFVTTSPLPNAVVGTPYTTTIETAGPDVAYELTRAPAGMVIDSATGVLSGWTPTTEDNVGVRVRISNAAGESTIRFGIRPFAIPAISTTTLVNGIVGQSYSDQIVFDGRNARLTKTSGTLPNGVTLKRGTAANGAGVLSGTPSKAGVFTLTVDATNASGSATRIYEVRVHDVPVIHVTKLDRAVVGQSYSDSVQFTGLDAEAARVKGSLPAGMLLNADGTFDGAPTDTGVFKFTVEVSNPAGSVKHRYRLVSFDVPDFQTTTLDQGIVGMTYSQQLTADGHNVRFVVPASSSLPAGLTLERNGLLHGTPTSAGDFTFDVRARNFAGKAVQSFTITVTLPATTLSSNNVIRGNTLTVDGTGYLPGDNLEIWLNSTPVLLGTTVAIGGSFTKTVRIPANTAAGAHHLVVKSAQSGTTSTPLTVALLPATPQAATPQGSQPQSPQLSVTPADDEPTAEAAIEDADVEESGDTAGAGEDELPTLNEPKAEDEAAAETPANLSALLIGGFALLLAALLLWFILWRRRRAEES